MVVVLVVVAGCGASFVREIWWWWSWWDVVVVLVDGYGDSGFCRGMW